MPDKKFELIVKPVRNNIGKIGCVVTRINKVWVAIVNNKNRFFIIKY